MDTLDPKQAAAVAYRQAQQIQGMADELRSYDSYQTPEDDQIAGGRYAIGRLLGWADSDLAVNVIPKLEDAVAALVRYADYMEVIALAIGDNPDWWKERVELWVETRTATATLFDKDGNVV